MFDHTERRSQSFEPDDGEWAPGGNPWLLVGTIVGAKLATIVVILVFSWSMETGGFVLATQWHWLPMIGALVAAPVAFAVRLRRVRAKRDALRRAEWLVSDQGLPLPTAVRSGERGHRR